MISPEEVRSIVRAGIPGSEVRVSDMTGTFDHFEITVTADVFAGKPLIEQHKIVFAVLEKAMQGDIHAVKIKTRVAKPTPGA